MTLAMLALATTLLAEGPQVGQASQECVFVLHGLARGPGSMQRLATALSDQSFRVRNFGYPSKTAPMSAVIAELDRAVMSESASCCAVHFVGYSLGAVVVRAYLAESAPAKLGRVVMIAPPNHGSEIVDALGGTWLFRTVIGPLATQLGTSAESLPNRLPAPRCPFGVIAGDRILSPWGLMFIRGEQDGSVTVQSTRLEGMSDFVIVHRTHTFIMDAPEVAAYTSAFLRSGRFRATVPDSGGGNGDGS